MKKLKIKADDSKQEAIILLLEFAWKKLLKMGADKCPHEFLTGSALYEAWLTVDHAYQHVRRSFTLTRTQCAAIVNADLLQAFTPHDAYSESVLRGLISECHSAII